MSDYIEDNLSKTIEALHQMWTAPGAPCDFGCQQGNVEKWTALARNLQTGKRIVIVRDWTWWDLDVPAAQLAAFESEGIFPAYLKSDAVVSDDSGSAEPGWWVRSTALVKLHENCVFETRNSLYIMLGTGTRKTVSPALAHAWHG